MHQGSSSVSDPLTDLGLKRLFLNLYICPQYNRLELFSERLCTTDINCFMF